MDDTPRKVRQGETYRYPKPAQVDTPVMDGLPNFYWHTATSDLPKAQLERGISRIQPNRPDNPVPAVLVRSSPWKAGTVDTPWHDYFDRSTATLHYFGDNKINEVTGLPKADNAWNVSGNQALINAHWHHSSETPAERAVGPPVLVFTGVPVGDRQKGNVRFDGLGVVVGAHLVRQEDLSTSEPYLNMLFDIRLVELPDHIDWGWISDRRRASVADPNRRAPRAWRTWIENGHDALDNVALRRWPVEPLTGT